MEQLFRYIIDKALEKGATDIHFHKGQEFNIIFRIHTHLILNMSLENEEGHRFLNYLKYMAKIDINQRFKPQTGSLDYCYHEKKIMLRVSFIPLLNQDSLVIRILNNQHFLSIEDLTPITPVQLYLQSILQYRQGLFIISGPTGAGKSTTLYSMLNTLVKDQQLNIITVEDPIEMISPKFTQIQINPQLGMNYDDTLRQILRHDPDVIMIGEIRDVISAKLMIECALTGHLVLTTLHGASCIASIKRLFQLNVNRVDLEEILIGMMSQKMLYSDTLNKLFCLYEFMDKIALTSYFMEKDSGYFQFSDCAQWAIQRQYLN